MAHGDYLSTERRLAQRYSLTTVFGVTNLLQDIHYLREKRYQGTDTTFLSCVLIDFERVVAKARLTQRQQETVFYHFEKDFMQGEIAEILGISQQAVSKHIDNAIAKIVIAAREEENKK